MELFETAVFNKITFASSKGDLTLYELVDLPLTSPRGLPNLDDIAKGLRKELQEAEDESFVVKASKANTLLQLKFDIVKHVITVRLAENEAKENARANAAQKQVLLEIRDKKQNEALASLSVEELDAKIAAL